VWEGYPPYGELESGRISTNERVVRAVAQDAARVIAAHYGMRAYTFVLDVVDLNVYQVD